MKAKKLIKNLSRAERGLGKYDAPLKFQYNQGISGFKRNKTNPFNKDTMQHREWRRGYNTAYATQRQRILNAESRRRS